MQLYIPTKNIKNGLITAIFVLAVLVISFFGKKDLPIPNSEEIKKREYIPYEKQFFDSDKEPQKLNLFISGTDGYDTYRIPSLIVTNKGTILAFCEGRKSADLDSGDIDIVLKRSFDNGETWTDMQVVYEEGGDAPIKIGNPCAVLDQKNNTVWLVFTKNDTRVFVTKSIDEGATWSEPVEITETTKKSTWDLYGPGPGVGIQLRNGKMIIPCYHGIVGDKRPLPTASHIIYSDDYGLTWKLGGGTADQGNECQVVELIDSTLLMAIRDYDGATVKREKVSKSYDQGLAWSYPEDHSDLPGTSCQLSLIRFTDEISQDKNRLLFSNPASATERKEMTVRLSYDEGETWPMSKMLYSGPSAYSCLAVLSNKKIGILYEAGEKGLYENIVFSRFSLEWLTDGKDKY